MDHDDPQSIHLDDPAWAAVFAYSEWLDGGCGTRLLAAPEGDERTHAELVNAFFAQRAS